mmetsp:Transcript_1140/g.4396  ORF Transcript_1140/g.4396 Transcript_1140/m.4396 type:complete len:205 (+) Transcript_1140:571-1185(+)
MPSPSGTAAPAAAPAANGASIVSCGPKDAWAAPSEPPPSRDPAHRFPALVPTTPAVPRYGGNRGGGAHPGTSVEEAPPGEPTLDTTSPAASHWPTPWPDPRGSAFSPASPLGLASSSPNRPTRTPGVKPGIAQSGCTGEWPGAPTAAVPVAASTATAAPNIAARRLSAAASLACCSQPHRSTEALPSRSPAHGSRGLVPPAYRR